MTELIRIPLGMVNAYLLRLGDNAILVDCGTPGTKDRLLENLAQLGVSLENLRLLLLTHNHPDHSGCAAQLRNEYGLPLAFHLWDSAPGPLKSEGLSGFFIGAVSNPGIKAAPPLLPDIPLEDGQNLKEYGIPASVLHMPGHTAGSVAVLADCKRCLCGDMYVNINGPRLASVAEDFCELRQSERRLLAHPIDTVFPGHGRPFRFARVQPGLVKQPAWPFAARPCPKGADCTTPPANPGTNS